MDAPQIIDLARQAVMLVFIIASPVLAAAFITALVISITQAVTQVQEHTLTFVPKIVVVGLVLLLLGQWMYTRLVEFGVEMFGTLP